MKDVHVVQQRLCKLYLTMYHIKIVSVAFMFNMCHNSATSLILKNLFDVLH